MKSYFAASSFALLVGAAGCGSSGSADELNQAVRSYSSAFLSGQGEKAAEMLSARCNTPQKHNEIVEAAASAPVLYGAAKIVSIAPTVAGNRATVTYRFDQPAIDQEGQPWVHESGSWHYDKC